MQVRTHEYLHSKKQLFPHKSYRLCTLAIQLLLMFLALCMQKAAVVPLLRDLHSVRMSKSLVNFHCRLFTFLSMYNHITYGGK